MKRVECEQLYPLRLAGQIVLRGEVDSRCSRGYVAVETLLDSGPWKGDGLKESLEGV
jgi:hypothetical protein